MCVAPLFVILFLLLLPPLSRPSTRGCEEVKDTLEEEVEAEVVVESSACSTTCGLGLKTQKLCLMKEGDSGMECRKRKVDCMVTWQCGLLATTVTAGQNLEISCLGEVMEGKGRYSWRVSWRYARGVITSNDRLFSRWESPRLDRLVLQPVREEDAGTYRCDVQDLNHRRRKRAYYGVRVLPAGVLNLGYPGSRDDWSDWSDSLHNLTVTTGRPLDNRTLRNVVLVSLAISVTLAGLILVGLYLMMR